MFGSRLLDDSFSLTTQDPWQTATETVDATVGEFFPIHQYPQNFERENGFSLLDILGIPGTEVNQNELYHAQEHDGIHTLPREPHPPSSEDNSNSSRSASTFEDPSNAIMEVASSGDRASSRRPLVISGVRTHSAFKFDDNEKIVSVICAYPKLLLSKDSQSPFIHHTFYCIAQGDVPGPLAIALCCISAYANVTKYSADFTCNMISTEADRLVTGFVSTFYRFLSNK